jgi:hypothetical protein
MLAALTYARASYVAFAAVLMWANPLMQEPTRWSAASGR